MAKSRDSSKKRKQINGKKRGNEKPSTAFRRPRHEKLEIKFDPEARRKYLTSLSSKKKERRAFGLAMQKVKDRKAKLEEKKEVRIARLEQVEEAEKSKELEYGEGNISFENPEADDNVGDNIDNNLIGDTDSKDENVTKFTDQSTQSQFGGQVIVTTTYHIPSDDEDDELEKDSKMKSVDKAQLYAGSVQKYMAKMKGQLPAKRNKNRERNNAAGKKGKHGAEGMKGMGSATDLKLAKKTLTRARDRQSQGKSNKGRRSKR